MQFCYYLNSVWVVVLLLFIVMNGTRTLPRFNVDIKPINFSKCLQTLNGDYYSHYTTKFTMQSFHVTSNR